MCHGPFVSGLSDVSCQAATLTLVLRVMEGNALLDARTEHKINNPRCGFQLPFDPEKLFLESRVGVSAHCSG